MLFSAFSLLQPMPTKRKAAAAELDGLTALQADPIFAPPLAAYAAAFARGGFTTVADLTAAHLEERAEFAAVTAKMRAAHAATLASRLEAAAERTRLALVAELQAMLRADDEADEADEADASDEAAEADEADASDEANEAAEADEADASDEANKADEADAAAGAVTELDALRALARRVAAKEVAVASLHAVRALFLPFCLFCFALPPHAARRGLLGTLGACVQSAEEDTGARTELDALKTEFVARLRSPALAHLVSAQ